jgi:hypothetical protein
MGLQLTLEDADQIINSTDQIKTEVTKHNNEEAWQNNPYMCARPAPILTGKIRVDWVWVFPDFKRWGWGG